MDGRKFCMEGVFNPSCKTAIAQPSAGAITDPNPAHGIRSELDSNNSAAPRRLLPGRTALESADAMLQSLPVCRQPA